jgi:pyruvate dehydrogenase E2 component (dihydrolipoamide acetyltransferase)
MIDILMPALSPTMEEGVLAKWHVKVGDTVKAGDVIAEIETDKATMEVEAVDEGEITDILVAEGTEGVKVNTRSPAEGRGRRGRSAAPRPPPPR